MNDLTPVLPEASLAVIDRAGRLTLDEIVRLDLAERRHPDALLVAWDLLRDSLARQPERARRMRARKEAWAAVNRSLAANGHDEVVDDGYWRVTARIGWGAARAARFAACAEVAPHLIDPDVAALLREPWAALGPEDKLESPSPADRESHQRGAID